MRKLLPFILVACLVVGLTTISGLYSQTIEFLTTSVNQVVTATHTFNPSGPPFTVGANAGGQEVAGLRAATVGALAANGANCAGNTFALGIDAIGAAECAQPAFANLSGAATDAQVPNMITIDLATLATTATTANAGDSATAFFPAGQLEVARGGSAADLSATGGANQFVKQSTTGGAFTVGTIGDPDVPNTILASGARALTGDWSAGDARAIRIGKLRSRTAPVYDVAAYGATIGDATNDCAAIQAAIDAANSAGGGEVLFSEAGTYTLGTIDCLTINGSNIRLKGVGGHGFFFADGATILSYTPTTGAAITVNAPATGDRSGIEFHDFTLKGPGIANAANGIVLKESTGNLLYTYLLKMNITQFNICLQQGTVSADILDLRLTTIDHSQFRACKQLIQINRGGEMTIFTTFFHGDANNTDFAINVINGPGGMIIDRSAFFATKAAGNHIKIASGFSYIISHNTFEDSHAEQGDYIFLTSGTRATRIVNNWFGGGVVDGTKKTKAIVVSGPRDVIIANNRFGDLANIAVTIDSGATQVVVSGNNFESISASSMVTLFGSTIKDITISNNTFAKAGVATVSMVEIVSDASHVTISGNTFEATNLSTDDRAIWFDATADGIAVWSTVTGNTFRGFPATGTPGCISAGSFPRKILADSNVGQCPTPPAVVTLGNNIFS